jgi:hypothetical protein
MGKSAAISPHNLQAKPFPRSIYGYTDNVVGLWLFWTLTAAQFAERRTRRDRLMNHVTSPCQEAVWLRTPSVAECDGRFWRWPSAFQDVSPFRYSRLKRSVGWSRSRRAHPIRTPGRLSRRLLLQLAPSEMC